MANSLLRREAFEYQGARFEVQGATGLSELDKSELETLLRGKSGRGEVHNSIYAEIIAQTVSAKNTKPLGFSVPKPNAPLATHQDAFEQVLGQPIELINMWLAAIQRVNAPPKSDTELRPDVVSDDPKSDGDEPTSAVA